MLDNIPEELRLLPQWVVWRYETKDGATKPTKVLYDPKNGKNASHGDRNTWSTFEDATNKVSNWNGIGFVLSVDDPYCFIDLDRPRCEGEEFERYSASQTKISEAFNSYQEISPSGKGLHIICRAAVPVGINKRKPGVEIYSDHRFMTMTGNVYKNVAIVDCQEIVKALYTELAGQQDDTPAVNRVQTTNDEAICNRAYAAKNGPLFIQLFKGDWRGMYPSQSEADQALLNILAFYTQNHEQLKRIFYMSALGKRDKAKRADYIKESIERALDREGELVKIDKLLEYGNEVLAQKRAVLTKLEERRKAGIDRALREKHEANAKIAREQIESKQQDSPFSIAPTVADGQEFTPPPGILGEIATYMYNQSAYPLPRTALTSAIAFMSAICGRAYNVNGLGCNLYLLLVAPTGTGKEAMSGGIAKLASAISDIVPGTKSYFGVNQIASGQALYAAIKERKAVLSIQGEFGVELQNLTHPRAPSPIKFLKKAYLDLFTKSGEGNELGASVFADKMKNTESIKSPALSILGETAPPHLWDALNETMMADGLIPRFTLIECDSGSEVYNAWAHTVRPPADLVQRIASMMAGIIKMDHMDRATHITMNAEAQHIAEQYRSVTKRTIESQSKESGRQVWSRAHVKALKLAALVAIGNNPYNPEIDADAFRWAVTMINDGTHRLMMRFERGELGEGDARQTADVKKFLFRYINENGATLPKFAFNEHWHRDRIVSYSYLRQNVIPLASFRLGVGGASQSFMRCVQSLCFEGAIKELDPALVVRYGTSGKLYALMDANLLR